MNTNGLSSYIVNVCLRTPADASRYCPYGENADRIGTGGGGRLSCYPEINHDFNNNHCFKFHDVLCTRAVSEIDSFLVYVYDLSGSYILMKMNLYRF